MPDMARRTESKMRGALQPHHAPLASNPSHVTGTARKRSHGMRDAPLDSPTAQLAAEVEATLASASDDDSPREAKRTRASPDSASDSKRSRTSPRRARASPGLTSRLEKASRFQEGSMRDRESQRPPPKFVHGDGSLEDDPTITAPEDTPRVSRAGERPRSGVFRFGRALATAFNPFVWPGMFGRERSSSPTKEATTPDDRKAKAEKAYAELKKLGLSSTRRPSAGSSARDSGIDLDSSYRTSDERKRDGLVFDSGTGTPLVLLSQSEASQPLTPETDAPSDRARKQHRRTSIPGLKQMKSHFSLKNIRRDAASPPDVPAEHAETVYRVKKKASKKDFQRQQKLTKRISNLETQLERARRELNESLDRPDVPKILRLSADPSPTKDDEVGDSPGSHGDETDGIDDIGSPVESPPAYIPQSVSDLPPRRFVPGALPSLPSERLLLPSGRMLPTTPTEEMSSMGGSPRTLGRLSDVSGSTELNSPAVGREGIRMVGGADYGDPVKKLARKSSIPRATRPMHGNRADTEFAAEDEKQPMKTAHEAPTDNPKPRASQLQPRYHVSDSDSDDSDATPSHPLDNSTLLRGGSAGPSPLSAAATAPPTASEIIPGISASDLRSLYQSSAHAKRLRATGSNSPRRAPGAGRTRISISTSTSTSASAASTANRPSATRTSGTGTSAASVGSRGIARRRSTSPRGARRVSSRSAKPVTATPGRGDERGEIVPPLPMLGGKNGSEVVVEENGWDGKESREGKEGKEARKIGGRMGARGGRGKGTVSGGVMSEELWEGWGDDVF